MSFTVGKVSVDVLAGRSDYRGVPTSQWHGDRLERTGSAILANLTAADGLRAQAALVWWPDGNEVSLRMGELFAGPSDYERLEDAGEISPKLEGDLLIARIRALRYGEGGRASGAVTDWAALDGWFGGDAQAGLTELGAVSTGTYGELYSAAARFKTEPAISVPASAPAALFAVYAISRVMPIMVGHGKPAVEGPHR